MEKTINIITIIAICIALFYFFGMTATWIIATWIVLNGIGRTYNENF